jgi:hypothetical protein
MSSPVAMTTGGRNGKKKGRKRKKKGTGRKRGHSRFLAEEKKGKKKEEKRGHSRFLAEQTAAADVGAIMVLSCRRLPRPQCRRAFPFGEGGAR